MLPEKIETLDFTCDERLSDSPFVELVWRSGGDEETPFISVAQPLSGIVVSNLDAHLSITVRGPETMASAAIAPPNSEHVGILFKPGVFMPKFSPINLKDRADITLPNGTNNTFWLNSSTWQFPDYENIDTFIEWLLREDLLCYDPIVAEVLESRAVDVSQRSTQRRFKKATGLTYGQLDQIKRARYATKLLKSGMSVLDTVYLASYFDQPHLIRSLKRFIGLTPQQIISEEREERLSLLYNTLPD